MAIVIDGNNTPTAGGVGYGDGTELAFTSAGTSGQPIVSGGASAPVFRPYTLPAADGSASQVLQTDGSGALSFVTLAAPPASGLTLLSTVTASNSATVDIETTFNSTYDSYLIVFSNVAPSSDTVSLRVLLKINGSYQTSGYNFHAARPDNTSSAYSAQGASAQAMIAITGGIAMNSRATTSGSTADMHLRINAPASTATIKSIGWNGSMAGATNCVLFGSGQFVTSFEALTGVRFFYSSGNILTGVFRLYGLANS
jgi:hypothetical protein